MIAFQGPVRPKVSEDRYDLVRERLLGAAMSAAVAVAEPAWFASVD